MGRKKNSASEENLTDRQKAAKKLPADVVEEFDTLSPDDIRAKLVTLAIHQDETEASKKDDAKLADAKAKVSEYSAPYTETIADIKARRKYLLVCLQESGQS